MKALKTLVISMGLLICIGLGFVGYGLTRSKHQPPVASATPGTEAMIPAAPAAVFATQYPLPKGARLEQMIAAGDRVVLRFSSPDGDKLVLLDSHTGQLAGTVTLTSDSK